MGVQRCVQTKGKKVQISHLKNTIYNTKDTFKLQLLLIKNKFGEENEIFSVTFLKFLSNSTLRSQSRELNESW
jgi:hypothetical protein